MHISISYIITKQTFLLMIYTEYSPSQKISFLYEKYTKGSYLRPNVLLVLYDGTDRTFLEIWNINSFIPMQVVQHRYAIQKTNSFIYNYSKPAGILHFDWNLHVCMHVIAFHWKCKYSRTCSVNFFGKK